MCLACEMDAWWVIEMEEPAPAKAGPGTAGVPPASFGESATAESVSAGEPSALSGAFQTEARPSRAGETPAVPGQVFRCEETRSE
jgi:hypothetical protein